MDKYGGSAFTDVLNKIMETFNMKKKCPPKIDPCNMPCGVRAGGGDEEEAPPPPPPTAAVYKRGRCKRPVEPAVCPPRPKKKSKSTLPGGAEFPGLLRHICHNAHCVTPLCFEGLLVNVRQKIACRWTLEHTLAFSQICPAGYRVLGAYSGSDVEMNMPYGLVEVSPGGYVTLEGRAAPTTTTRAAVMGQLAKGDVANWECTFDAYFNSGTASVLTVNREMIAMHYFHAITRNIGLGVEAVAWGAQSSAAGALQWRSESAADGDGGNYASLFAGTRGVDMCYAHLVWPCLTVAGKIEVVFTKPRCVATMAYEYRGTPSKRGGGTTTARGSLDTDGLVGATLERSLGATDDASLSVALSALYNLTNDKFGLGFRLSATLL